MESQKQPIDTDAPLPISELSDRLSSETFEWLESVEKHNESEDNDEAPTAANLMLFGNDDEHYARVEEWSSSTTNPDGIGGYQNSTSNATNQSSPSSVSVKYILSDAPGGHGDDVWAAARHVSNLLADSSKCVNLIKSSNSQEEHPLLGIHFLELGAGAGLPSWTAMKCGARVVCTDQPIAHRIRCMAESAQRNYKDMVSELSQGDPKLAHAQQARVCPYSWGDKNTSELLMAGNDHDDDVNTRKFDVIVAADCIYNPMFHSALLDSIDMLLAQDGLALLPFALHGNTNDENVWAIVPLAREHYGFKVETLESQQLSPQISTMNRKRGLVNMLRLGRK